VIALDLILGVIFDTLGRKVPTVIGFVIAGLAILGTPWFTEVYPGFLCMRVMMSVGIIPGLNNPLLPDYVNQKSLGLANAYVRLKYIDNTYSKILYPQFQPSLVRQ
jgi:MFS family permease